MTEDILDRARKALDGVTPGPWWHDNNEGYGANNVWCEVPGDVLGKDIVAKIHHDSAEAEANARLIAAARDLVPAMADEIERMRAENAGLKEYAENVRAAVDGWRQAARLAREAANLKGAK